MATGRVPEASGIECCSGHRVPPPGACDRLGVRLVAHRDLHEPAQRLIGDGAARLQVNSPGTLSVKRIASTRALLLSKSDQSYSRTPWAPTTFPAVWRTLRGDFCRRPALATRAPPLLPATFRS
jgi:hypothetical protein